MQKSERLLDLIAALLESRVPMSADDVRREIPGYTKDKDSFRRAFERDKRTLREMGIPLITVDSPTGDPNDARYRIPPEEYYLRDPGLRADELAALRLAVDAIRLDGVDADGGIQKLGGDAGGSDGAVAVVPFNQHAPVVLEAISKHRRLQFTYRGSEDGATRRVDPLHLHSSRGRWHLHAFDHDRGEKRQFRLDRITGDLVVGEDGSAIVTKLEEPIEVALHGWTLGSGDPVETRVWIAANQAPVARQEIGADADIEERDDGSIVVTLPVRNVSGLRSFVLGFLDDAEVLGPPAMRDDFAEWLRLVAATA